MLPVVGVTVERVCLQPWGLLHPTHIVSAPLNSTSASLSPLPGHLIAHCPSAAGP